MTEAHLHGEERGKQTVAVLLKEAEFLRDEILLSTSAIRTLLTATITFIGVLLTITAGFMAFKASEKGITVNVVGGDIAKSGEKPVQFGQLVVANRWPLWIVSTVGVITCVAFLRIHVGSLAGIFNAAEYYRDFIRPKLSAVLGTEVQVLYWENWLQEKKAAGRIAGEEIFASPIFIWLIGIGFAYGGLRLTRYGEKVQIVSICILLLIIAVGALAIVSISRLTREPVCLYQKGLPTLCALWKKIRAISVSLRCGPPFRDATG